MDSLKPENQQSQYNNLNEKLYGDIDALNKEDKITNQLILLMSMIEGTFHKTEKSKKDFYVKAVNLKILSYLPRLEDEEAVLKTFSLINKTLPVFNNTEPIKEDLELYLAYLLDLILQHRNSHANQIEIMLKIAKTGNLSLLQRVTRNITIFLKNGLVKQSIYPLMKILLNSDK